MQKADFDKKFASKLDPKTFQNETARLILLESEKRGVPSEVVMTLFGNELSQVKKMDDKKALLEDLLTEIDRKK